MTTRDKMRNAAEEATGKVEQAVGAATDNPSQQRRGELREKKGQTKQAGEKLKDAVGK